MVILQLAVSHNSEEEKALYASQVEQKKVAQAQKPLTNVRIGWISPTEERDGINIKKLKALFVVMPIHYLVYGYVKRNTNILKMHMCANIKK